MGKMTYNRSRYYTQSTSSMLNDSREAHSKTLESLKQTKNLVEEWKMVARWFAHQYAQANSINIDEALEECYNALETGSTDGQ